MRTRHLEFRCFSLKNRLRNNTGHGAKSRRIAKTEERQEKVRVSELTVLATGLIM